MNPFLFSSCFFNNGSPLVEDGIQGIRRLLAATGPAFLHLLSGLRSQARKAINMSEQGRAGRGALRIHQGRTLIFFNRRRGNFLLKKFLI
jgi:hypothetical protein